MDRWCSLSLDRKYPILSLLVSMLAAFTSTSAIFHELRCSAFNADLLAISSATLASPPANVAMSLTSRGVIAPGRNEYSTRSFRIELSSSDEYIGNSTSVSGRELLSLDGRRNSA